MIKKIFPIQLPNLSTLYRVSTSPRNITFLACAVLGGVAIAYRQSIQQSLHLLKIRLTWNQGDYIGASDAFIKTLGHTRKTFLVLAIERYPNEAPLYFKLANLLGANEKIKVSQREFGTMELCLESLKLKSDTLEVFNKIDDLLNSYISNEKNKLNLIGSFLEWGDRFYEISEKLKSNNTNTKDLQDKISQIKYKFATIYNQVGITIPERRILVFKGINLFPKELFMKALKLAPENPFLYINLGVEILKEEIVVIGETSYNKNELYIKAINLVSIEDDPLGFVEICSHLFEELDDNEEIVIKNEKFSKQRLQEMRDSIQNRPV